MRKVGIFYAYWEKNWAADYLPYVEKVRQLGYEQLEVHASNLHAMGKEKRARLRGEAEAKGITLSYGIGLTAKQDPSSLDESVRKEGVATMRRIIDAIAELGGGMVGGTVQSYWPAQLPLGCVDKRPYLDQSLKSMVELAKVAEDKGVVLNVEVLNRFEHFMFNTSSEARAFVERVNSPAVGILLDTFHMNIEEDSFAQAIITAGRYLNSLHLGEPNRKPLSERSRLPIADIKQALDQIDYQGALVQEPFVQQGGEVGYNIRVYRPLLPPEQLDQAARESAAFIKENLR